jgi:hypothetical protein
MRKMIIVYMVTVCLFVTLADVVSPFDNPGKIIVAVILGSLYSIATTALITWANSPKGR